MTQDRKWFAFAPGRDTALAVMSLMAMTIIYYLNARFGYDHPAVFFVGFLLVGHIMLNTALPAWVVLRVRGEGLAGLGITPRRWKTALLVSLALAAMSWPALHAELETFEGELLPNMAFNAISLWEPLFVYGWLQLRFERAFGIVPAVLLAGLSFMAYHIGTFAPQELVALLLAGTFFAVVFAAIRNLLVLAPFTWMVSSTMGTIQGGFDFDWGTVAIYAAVLVVQIAVITAIRTKVLKGRPSGMDQFPSDPLLMPAATSRSLSSSSDSEV